MSFYASHEYSLISVELHDKNVLNNIEKSKDIEAIKAVAVESSKYAANISEMHSKTYNDKAYILLTISIMTLLVIYMLFKSNVSNKTFKKD